MKVLDAPFLADYLADVDAASRYLEEHSSERFVFPTPAFAEVLVGEGNGPDGSDIEGASSTRLSYPPIAISRVPRRNES